MKKVLQFILLAIAAICLSSAVYAQTAAISGFVYDLDSGEPLEMANIKVKGTSIGSTSDENGFFSFDVSSTGKIFIEVSYIGYKDVEMEVEPGIILQIKLEPDVIMGAEVVISASRVDEKIMEAPLTIQKMNVKQIENAASGDYFSDLSNMRDVEIINNSIGFKVFNARGFNTTSQLRVVQFIDGVDNQLPTINIVTGNMFGVNDLDLESVEVISGPASAMYGPNAMQGVLSMNTKSPFKYRGVSLRFKAGTREYGEVQFRYADVFAKGKLGFKITGSAMTAKDWVADDPKANRYGNQPTPPQNFNQVIQDKADEGIPIFQQFVDYAAQYPDANPGMVQFKMPGYMESELYDGKTNNFKIGGGLYYKAMKEMMLSYEGRYSTGTSIYMGNNRAPMEGFYQMQHVLGLDYKGFSFKAYMSQDDTKNIYSLPATGVLMGFSSMKNVGPAFLGTYVGSIAELSGGFSNPYNPAWGEVAEGSAMMAANGQWLQPGTSEWDAAFDKVTSNPPPFGSNFQNKTCLYHLEALYNHSFNKIDLNVGASFRNTNPVSHGAVFADTAGIKINVAEYGGFAQAIWNAVENRLKIFGSVRVDKSSNYDLQLSPRLAFVFNVNENHVLRLTGQSAFRSPAVTDQYQYLNKGYGFTIGNINGFGNAYTYSSVVAFDGTNPQVLQTTYVDGVKPEQLQSIELGYNGLITKKFFVDLSLYYNMYSDFITYVEVARPNGDAVAGEPSGVEAIKTRNYTRYLVATNTNQDMNTYGASIGLTYFIKSTLKVYGNYTYSKLDTANFDKNFMLAYNTPEHKINIGMEGKIYKGFGFALNWRWVDDYTWESVFAPYPNLIKSYNVTDLQFSFEVPRLMSTLRVGGSNIFNQEYIQATGMPQIGAFYYASWTFNFDFKK
ncbi:MAG: TonB-dependent receptor [Bacteroidales bacterium]|nr:TonB-dependent receptor [Bacteroidales bacterium]